MKVGAVSSGAAAMQRPAAAEQGHGVGTDGQQDQKQQIQAQKAEKEEPGQTIQSNYQNDFYSTGKMSSQDFLALHNDAAAGDMVEAIKDIVALQVLEKTLEAINKIMED